MLFTGPSEVILSLGASGPTFSNEEYIIMMWRVARQVIVKHAIAAQSQRKSLRAYLEDLAGYREGGWYALSMDVCYGKAL